MMRNIAKMTVMTIAMMKLEPSDSVTASRHPSCVLLPGLPLLQIILASRPGAARSPSSRSGCGGQRRRRNHRPPSAMTAMMTRPVSMAHSFQRLRDPRGVTGDVPPGSGPQPTLEKKLAIDFQYI
jgi:hypothetical protein